MAELNRAGEKPAGLAVSAMLLPLFALALLTSAFLMFSVQPMFAKLVLPHLGGSQAVWSFSLVFFQAVLLLGYGYAHLLSRHTTPVFALALHSFILAAGLAALPVAVDTGWAERASRGDLVALAAVFGLGCGLPVFAISATAPLLQSWFARTGHAQANDPYFLYGASNIGSFAALALYPFAIEPLAALTTQAEAWRIGFMALGVLILLCGLMSLTSVSTPAAAAERAAAPASAAERLKWIGLAAVPSGLLVAVTAHIATDIVAAPFVWVVPLALFLATFVIVFAKRPVISHERALWLHVAAVAPFAGILFLQSSEVLSVCLHLAAFFITALVCHGELARSRPAAHRLTEFYFLMSVGGVTGGIFASLIAPQIFNRIYEYPILLAAAFACRRDFWEHLRSNRFPGVLPWMAALAAIALAMTGGTFAGAINGVISDHGMILLGAIVIATFAYRSNRFAQSGCVALILAIMSGFGISRDSIETVRSMYGVNMVLRMDEGVFHVLAHGTTIHGAQRWLDANGLNVSGLPKASAYYYDNGPFGEAIGAVRAQRGGLEKVGVIGLGSGALACQQRGAEKWSFFEIDPEVIRIAQNPALFTYLDKCGLGSTVEQNDGRLALAAAPPSSFDLLVIDAFSSDSIPTHLLTLEAFDVYRSRLKPGGVMLFHLSNRYMELGSVVTALAAERGETAFLNRLKDGVWPMDSAERQTRPWIAAVAPAAADLGVIATDGRWHQLPREGLPDLWTDDYSNVLAAILRLKGRSLDAMEAK